MIDDLTPRTIEALATAIGAVVGLRPMVRPYILSLAEELAQLPRCLPIGRQDQYL